MAKLDIHIQLVDPVILRGTQFYTFGFKRTVAISGIQKLFNNWAKYLLTPVGSNPNDLNEGTTFTSLISSNIPLTDTKDILSLAINKTNKAIRDVQRTLEVPLDERLATATITAFVELPSNPGFTAQVLIRNFSNEGIQVLLPTLDIRT